MLPHYASGEVVGELLQKLLHEPTSTATTQELLSRLKGGDVRQTADWIGSTGASGSSSSKLADALRSLNTTADPVSIHALSEVTGSKYRVAFALADLKRFSDGFAAGGKNPQAAFSRLTDPKQIFMTARWQAKPVEQRVGIICALSDLSLANHLRESLEKQGKMAFVYKVCEEQSGHLCPNETVGAFMTTAGDIQVIMSPAAQQSSFVMREITLAQQLRAGQPPEVILFTPEFLVAPFLAQVLVADN